MHCITSHLLKPITAANSQDKKSKSWFYVFPQNFVLPLYTNLGKAEICIKCSQLGLFANHFLGKTITETHAFSSFFLLSFMPSFSLFYDFLRYDLLDSLYFSSSFEDFYFGKFNKKLNLFSNYIKIWNFFPIFSLLSPNPLDFVTWHTQTCDSIALLFYLI